MKKAGKILFFSIAIVALLLLVVCRFKQTEKTEKTEKTEQTDPMREYSASERLENERKIKNVARESTFVIAVRTGSRFTCTGFFIDGRGYLATAKHCLNNLTLGEKPCLLMENGAEYCARIVEELQTIDLAILAIDQPIGFAAEFADFEEVRRVARENYGRIQNLPLDVKMVAVRCINRDGSGALDRIYVGKLAWWNESENEISFTQLQQGTGGCSGAPIINLEGKVVGMLRSSGGDLVYGIDAPTIRDSARVIIEEDVARKIN